MITDAIQAIRRSCGPSHPLINGTIPYEAELFVDDAMFAEPRLGTRRIENVGSWDRSRTGVLGVDSINMGQMGQEGIWSQEQIMMGFEINTEDYTIALPDAKIEGARLFVVSDTYIPGTMQMEIKEIQVLRGLRHHWLVSSFAGKL